MSVHQKYKKAEENKLSFLFDAQIVLSFMHFVYLQFNKAGYFC